MEEVYHLSFYEDRMQKNRHLSCNAIDGCRKVSHADKKPCMLTAVEELKVKSSINNKKSVSIQNLLTFN